jgi:nitrate reductase gamma subunit
MITRAAVLILGLLLYLPAFGQESEMMPRKIGGQPRVCLDCHRTPNIQTNEGTLTSQGLCYECHTKDTAVRRVGDQSVSLKVFPESFQKNRHATVACIECHRDVARSPHTSRTGAQCLSCHSVHGEGKVHDPHLRVSCQACHHPSKTVFLNTAKDQVQLARFTAAQSPLALTDHSLSRVRDKAVCQRCHFPKNPVGASASVLPAKSILCLPCHSAPLAIGHPLFWGAFLILLLGALGTVFFWLQGSAQGEEASVHRKMALSSEALWGTLFSRQAGPLLKTFFFDILLQRRILQESVARWSIHSLIYWSILLRFGLGLLTLVAYRIGPGSGLARVLIDKNNPFVALTNDLLGLFLVIGLVWALGRRFITKPRQVLSEGQDHWALGILGILVILGFVCEGARILMTHLPVEKAVYSFMGYLLSRLFSRLPLDWAGLYPYLWYAHALVGALLIATLPFGKLKHLLTTPLTLLLNYKPSCPAEGRMPARSRPRYRDTVGQ